MIEQPKTLLFLCTGNYFRSRFSEELFNHWARRLQLDWHAESRGLMSDMRGLKQQNVGRISRHALTALTVRGVRPNGSGRWPQSVTRAEIDYAHRTIALKEAEHRPMMLQRFPELADRIEYWSVDDIDVLPPQRCIAQAEERLLELIQELRATKT